MKKRRQNFEEKSKHFKSQKSNNHYYYMIKVKERIKEKKVGEN